MDFLLAHHVGSRKGSEAKRAVVTKINPKADHHAAKRQFASAFGFSLEQLKSDHAMRVGPKTARYISIKSTLIEAMMDSKANSSTRGTDLQIFDFLERLCETPPSSCKGGCDSRQNIPMAPVSVLECFEKHLVQDEAALNFDYVGFYKVCADAFKDTDKAVGARLSCGEGVVGLVLGLLHEMAVVLDSQTSGNTSDAGKSLVDSAFEVAAGKLNALIRNRGNEFSKAAFERSSGYIPKALRPSLPPPRSPANNHTLEILVHLGLLDAGIQIANTQGCCVLYDPGGGFEKLDTLLSDGMPEHVKKEFDLEIERYVAAAPGNTKLERESNAIRLFMEDAFRERGDGTSAPSLGVPKVNQASVEDAEEDVADTVRNITPFRACNVIEAVEE